MAFTSRRGPGSPRLSSGGQQREQRFGRDAQLDSPRLSESDQLDIRLCPQGHDACERVPGYFVVSMRSALRLSEHWRLSVALENVFDAAYRTHASGAYAPGRNLIASLRANP